MNRGIIARIIMRLPGNSFRIFLYRKLLGYNIGRHVVIGKSVIICQSVRIGNNVVIKDFNELFCKSLVIGDNTKIGSGNRIAGRADFSIGTNSRVLIDHYIDVTRNVSIGNNTWLAGKGSQFWTHGSIHTKTGKKLTIQIKDDIYISSNCSIAPGVIIENGNLIGLGSVVTKSVKTTNNIIAGNPAEIVKENADWKENW